MKEIQSDKSRSGESGGREALNNILTEGKGGVDRLPPKNRQRMEEQHGTDFSGVDVHQASSEADGKNARAMTRGQAIHFGTGQFQPDSEQGQQLIDHELTHVRENQLQEQGLGEEATQQDREQEATDAAQGQGGPATKAGAPGQPQYDIKSDLEEAMDGWGTDEDAIYGRLRRATPAELRSVVGDSGLMEELRDELTQSEMSRVLDLLDAPLEDKLNLAMDGWGTDEAYIRRVLNGASDEELQALAGNDAMVNRLEGELSGDDLKFVLDKLDLLERKLEFACRGWGTDEEYIFTTIGNATVDEIRGVIGNAGLMTTLEDDLTGEEMSRLRGALANPLYDAGDAEAALQVLMDDDAETQTRNLDAFGGIERQRELCETVITTSNDLDTVKAAFSIYWNVEIDVQSVMVDNDGDGVKETEVTPTWTVSLLQDIHDALKELPEGDVRESVWAKLVLKAQSTGGSMSSGGTFKIGDGAAGVGTQPYGQGTTLSAAVASGDTEIQVSSIDTLEDASDITIDTGGASEEQLTVKSVDTGASKIEVDGALGSNHAAGDRVDVTGHERRDIDWVDAVVRHEIAHALDTALGGVMDFKQNIGGWWWDTDIDTWAAQMGSPWNTSSGNPVPDADKTEIKDHISAFTATDGGKPLNDGLDAGHAINTWWNEDVPIIEAAKACAPNGKRFWQNPGDIKDYNGNYFSVNHYYHKFQYYKAEVHENRVRDYAIFSAAEFFAEVYTVYYEEAGQSPAPEPGRLLPVASWKSWLKTNVEDRGMDPSGATAAGHTNPSVGATTGNDG